MGTKERPDTWVPPLMATFFQAVLLGMNAFFSLERAQGEGDGGAGGGSGGAAAQAEDGERGAKAGSSPRSGAAREEDPILRQAADSCGPGSSPAHWPLRWSPSVRRFGARAACVRGAARRACACAGNAPSHGAARHRRVR